MTQSVGSMISQEASEWFVMNRDASIDHGASGAFAIWLKTSPLHVQEYLAIAQLAAELQDARDPALSVEAVLAEVRKGDENIVPITGSATREYKHSRTGFWRPAAAAAAILAASAAAFLWWGRPAVTIEHLATQHGEQKSFHLADNSNLRLNTDTALTVRYGHGKREVDLIRGQVMFEVVHDAQRPFLVSAGSAEVRDIGTAFDVYRQGDATRVTVVSGEVAVTAARDSIPRDAVLWQVQVRAGEQVQVSAGVLKSGPVRADLRRSTAWLRRQIVFEQEPLGQVAAEFNRYSVIPIRIKPQSLGDLAISGVFAADDTESFIAFLRSLDGVSVDVTSTAIDVRKH